MRAGGENSAVRPLCAAKGLSPDEVLETVNGEYIPVREEDRHAEKERVDLPEDEMWD